MRESNRVKDQQDIGTFEVEEGLTNIVGVFNSEGKYELHQLQDLNANLLQLIQANCIPTGNGGPQQTAQNYGY